MASVDIFFSQIKLLFGPLVIQLLWYILKQLFTSVSVKVVDIYRAAKKRKTKKRAIFSVISFHPEEAVPSEINWKLCNQRC